MPDDALRFSRKPFLVVERHLEERFECRLILNDFKRDARNEIRNGEIVERLLSEV